MQPDPAGIALRVCPPRLIAGKLRRKKQDAAAMSTKINSDQDVLRLVAQSLYLRKGSRDDMNSGPDARFGRFMRRDTHWAGRGRVFAG